nr:hypothetical protein Ade03nite_40530 [Actinoplanes derwentensis]
MARRRSPPAGGTFTGLLGLPLLPFEVLLGGADLAVEVVGGLVEQPNAGAFQQLGGEAQGDHLAAAESAEAAVEGDLGEAETVEFGAGALLDVPVVTDRGEMLLGRVAGLDGVQGGQHPVDAEDLRDRLVRHQRQVLRQISEHTTDGDGAAGRAQRAGDQFQQRGLAGAVGGHQPGAALRHGERQAIEDRSVIRPRKGQIGDRNGHGDPRE